MTHLTIVAVARNDSHGGDLLGRLQQFVTLLSYQCCQHNLRAELILVEWNPPSERPSLAEALHWPQQDSLRFRIITVPSELHMTFRGSKQLPLFQMIGKNVGIRRAKSNYILATNIDIIFNRRLIAYLRDNLSPNKLVRVDRFDVPPLPQDYSPQRWLTFCEANITHVYSRYGVYEAAAGNHVDRIGRPQSRIADAFYSLILRKPIPFFHHWRCDREVRQNLWADFSGFIKEYFMTSQLPHFCACGDFTLLSRNNWFELGGYPEYQGYSWHLDTLLLYGARARGIQEVSLSPFHKAFHIAHGAGWRPDIADELFQRLEKQGIPYLSDAELWRWVNALPMDSEEQTFNSTSWGLAEHALDEVVP